MKVSQIYIYPIKSLRGVSVPTANATRQGFEYDRRFMLLKVIQNPDDGTETLKNMHVPHFTEMALFETELVGLDSSQSASSFEGKSPELVRVRWRPAADHDASQTEQERQIDIPLRPDTRGLEELAVVMHSSPTKGYNMGDKYNGWFSECFGYPVVLAYLGPNWRRVLGSFPPGKSAVQRESVGEVMSRLRKKGASLPFVLLLPLLLSGVVLGTRARVGAAEDMIKQSGPMIVTGLLAVIGAVVLLFALERIIAEGRKKRKEERITFADASPYMVVSATSVANVSDRLEGDEVMDPTKFRANLVIEGAETAFEEDFWAELAIGGQRGEEARLLLTANCVRCRSLDVDYATGKMGTGESGKVLKKLMTDRRVDRGAKYNPVFGRYAFLDGREMLRSIRVGDEVVVARKTNERAIYDWPGLA